MVVLVVLEDTMRVARVEQEQVEAALSSTTQQLQLPLYMYMSEALVVTEQVQRTVAVEPVVQTHGTFITVAAAVEQVALEHLAVELVVELHR
jgi:hypothetical protein